MHHLPAVTIYNKGGGGVYSLGRNGGLVVDGGEKGREVQMLHEKNRIEIDFQSSASQRNQNFWEKL